MNETTVERKINTLEQLLRDYGSMAARATEQTARCIARVEDAERRLARLEEWANYEPRPPFGLREEGA